MFLAPFAPLIGAIGALGGGAAALLNKPGKMPGLAPPPTRDDAAALALRNDELARRRGAAADIITGTSGAEARSGTRFVLGN